MFIKPWLMGKGAPVPMLVIFLGAVGGMMMSGFIGLLPGYSPVYRLQDGINMDAGRNGG
jgi:hypothetical protein